MYYFALFQFDIGKNNTLFQHEMSLEIAFLLLTTFLFFIA